MKEESIKTWSSIEKTNQILRKKTKQIQEKNIEYCLPVKSRAAAATASNTTDHMFTHCLISHPHCLHSRSLLTLGNCLCPTFHSQNILREFNTLIYAYKLSPKSSFTANMVSILL